MNLLRTLRRVVTATLLVVPALPAITQAAGLLTPANSNLPELVIRSHHVNVTIEDGYATTSVEQVYHNPNGQALDAIYSFPVPAKAAVGEFTYWINDQPITAEVVEKQKARQIYEEEKKAGRETALVEKDGFKTFDISVASVQPNSDVRIKLVYLQPAHVDTGVGRYVYPLEDGGVDEQKLAFWTRNETVQEAFSFNVTLRNSYPIDGLRLPNQPSAQIHQPAPDTWQASIANGTANPTSQVEEGAQPKATPSATAAQLNKDIVLYWRHSDGLPGSLDMVAYRKDTQSPGTFMLTLTPGDDLAPLTQQGRDWVFVLDVSGSMSGKYGTLIDGVRQGLQKLPVNDRFKIVLFNNRAQDFSGGFLPATPEAITPLLNRLEQYQPDKGTNLYAGLKKGLKGLNTDRATALVLVTDGVANVGVTEKKAFLKLLEHTDLRLFTFIMGNSANRPLLEGMTKVSQGFALSVSNADDVMGQIMLAANKMSYQALRDIDLRINGGRVTDLTPESIGSLYHGQQLIVMGHYRKAEEIEVVLSGKVGSETRSYSTRIQLPQTSELNPELERLWAYAAIENLQDKIEYLGGDADSEDAITDIAKTYGLVTDYTSMIVVRDERFRELGIDRDNKQRVEREQQARAEREQKAVRNHRADSAQPMFANQRSTLNAAPSGGSGGAGSIGPWLLLAILVVLIVQARSARKD